MFGTNPIGQHFQQAHLQGQLAYLSPHHNPHFSWPLSSRVLPEGEVLAGSSTRSGPWWLRVCLQSTTLGSEARHCWAVMQASTITPVAHTKAFCVRRSPPRRQTLESRAAGHSASPLSSRRRLIHAHVTLLFSNAFATGFHVNQLTDASEKWFWCATRFYTFEFVGVPWTKNPKDGVLLNET